MESEYLLYINTSELLVHANKVREYIANGQTEDAIAYALAMGARMGWEAHKKKVENINSK